MVGWRTRIAAYGLAVHEGRVLLARIADGSRFDGQWTLPGGGLDAGESPESAMVREFREETGLVPTLGPVLGVNSIVVAHADGPFHGVRVVYRVEASGMPMSEVDGSTDQAAWLDLDDLPPVVDLVTWALERL